MRDTPRHAGTPSRDPLLYNAEVVGKTVIYRCKGAFALVNHSRLGELAEETRRGEAAHVVLDLREVSYVDSMGVGAIAVMLKDTRARSRALTLVATEEMRLLLGASKLVGLLTFADTPEAALSA